MTILSSSVWKQKAPPTLRSSDRTRVSFKWSPSAPLTRHPSRRHKSITGCRAATEYLMTAIKRLMLRVKICIRTRTCKRRKRPLTGRLSSSSKACPTSSRRTKRKRKITT